MRTKRNQHLMPLILVLGLGSVLLTGCGGGGPFGGGDYYGGDVEVDNQTDLSGSYEDLYFFEMALSGTQQWTGDLLPQDVYPGEIVYLGTFDEDFYDAEGDLDFGHVTFYGMLVEDGYTTTFEVF